MKRFRKMALAALAFVMLFGGTTARAEDFDLWDFPELPAFTVISGVVAEILPGNDYDPTPDFIITIGESSARIVTNFNTLFLGEMPNIGDTIQAHHPTELFMITIYPPQHIGRVIVNQSDENLDIENILVERFYFDEDFGALISGDGGLILNFTDDSPIYLQDGQNFREIIYGDLIESLHGRLLAVKYGPTTRMMPPSTIPGEDGQNVMIYVLFETAVHLPGLADPDFGFPGMMPPLLDIEIPENPIVVNGMFIEQGYRQINGVYYVPLRAVVNAIGLGDTIVWNPATASVSLYGYAGQHLHFAPGSPIITIDGETTTLNHPTLLLDGTTYVPFNFFASQIFGMNNAHQFEGQIEIDNFEPMR